MLFVLAVSVLLVRFGCACVKREAGAVLAGCQKLRVNRHKVAREISCSWELGACIQHYSC
jgi:hypothetical protein